MSDQVLVRTHEGAGRIRAGLQRAGRCRAGAAVDRRARRNPAVQRQAATYTDDRAGAGAGRTKGPAGVGRQRLLLGRESSEVGKEEDRLIRSDGQANAQSTRPEQSPRTHPEIRYAGRPDEAQTDDEDWPRDLRTPQDYRRAGLRSDQTGAGIPTVPVAWSRKSPLRVGACLRHTQCTEDLPGMQGMKGPLPAINGAPTSVTRSESNGSQRRHPPPQRSATMLSALSGLTQTRS